MFFEFNEAPVALARGKAVIEPEGYQATPDSAALVDVREHILLGGDLAPALPPEDEGIMPHIILDDFLF